MPDKVDPYRNCRFLLEIGGDTKAAFKDVTIGDTTQDPIDYREGDEIPTVRKIPGLCKFGNVSMKWGITDSMDVYNWRKMVEEGKMKTARKSIAIVILDEEGQAKCRFEFVRAWPTKYTAPTLNATANEIAIEALDIAHEGLIRTK